MPILVIFRNKTKGEEMFKLFLNVEKLPDSMCLDSGTEICRYEDDGASVTIGVRGCVKVEYDGCYYRSFSGMPLELQNMFYNGSAYNNPKVIVHEGNWYEVFFNQDEQCDVAEIDGEEVANLEGYCRDCMELFKNV